MSHPGDHVVHIGENAELEARSRNNWAGLLSLDEPRESTAEPHSHLALLDALALIDGDHTWRPVVTPLKDYRGDDETVDVLAFVRDDDPETMVIVCPVAKPEINEEATA